jgi:hypothetical protein
LRAYHWLAAAVLVAACTAPARAQNANVPFGMPNNNTLTYNIINPASSPNTIATPQQAQTTGTRLQNFLHWFTPWNNTPVIGQSSYPAPGALIGPNYLQSFGFKLGGN